MTEKNTTPSISKRNFLLWTPPTILSLSLPTHAQASVTNDQAREYCGDFAFNDNGEPGSISIKIHPDDSIDIAMLAALNVVFNFTGTTTLQSDNSFSATLTNPDTADSILVNGQVSSSGTSINCILPDNGETFSALQNNTCLTGFTVDTCIPPALDNGIEITDPIADTVNVTWTFNISPAVTNNTSFAYVVSCNGGPFTYPNGVPSAGGTNNSQVTVTASPGFLGCTGPGTIEVQILTSTPTLPPADLDLSSISNCPNQVVELI